MSYKILHFLRITTILLILTAAGVAQGNTEITKGPFILKWNPFHSQEVNSGRQETILSFEGSLLDQKFGLLPVFNCFVNPPAVGDTITDVVITEPVYLTIGMTKEMNIRDHGLIGNAIQIWNEPVNFTGDISHRIAIMPVRLDTATGSIQVLVSFGLSITFTTGIRTAHASLTPKYATASVLAEGAWYKFSVTTSGIYRIGYEDLKTAGIDPATINPQNIRIFGNGGGMLPESNAKSRVDDLLENSIYVSGEDDGKFDAGDYILFYGESPDTWSYSKTDQLFHHSKNSYSDQTCYFLNFDHGAGKRVGKETSLTDPATSVATTFNDYAFYERDDINLAKSGREWWDQQFFDITTVRNYAFSFPNIDGTKKVTLTGNLAARSTIGSSAFTIYAQGNSLLTLTIPSTSGTFDDDYAKQVTGSGSFFSTNPAIDIRLSYLKSASSSVGYLNYLEVNATRQLIMYGSQMSFRSASVTNQGAITEFVINSNGQNLSFWDVTSIDNIRRLDASKTGNNYIFRVATDDLREFIAFDGSSFASPTFIGKVENQNLHATQSVDYIIVTHPLFMDEANRLAEFHREQSQFSVFVTTPEKIYNEFSSGVQDITAIRDFVRMIYNKAEPGKEPAYLLLFGDASYDYKDRIQNNTNYVPSYASVESFSPVNSFVADDYFGKLKETEGQSANGNMCIGIGRFPVATLAEAKSAVDKVIHYSTNRESVMNDWRNVITFVADDQNEGGNMFIKDSEDLAKDIENQFKAYNVDKIYSDAYTMVSTPGGARYPEVNDVINKRVEKGCLIMNYIGHGGEVGWAHERILEVPDIKAWRNFNNMPVFVTATCEFSRFDDPERTSAGEWVFLNSNGGGISLFTTTRLTFAGTNKTLLDRFYMYLFVKNNGKYLRMGDLLREAKDSLGNSSNVHSFVLLGDPAMKIAFPDLNVVTTEINTQENKSLPDTLKALSVINIRGEIRDAAGDLQQGFSGTLFPTVYDKPSEIWTKANYGYDDPFRFFLRKNPVYKGKVEVVNGQFSFSFIVPKDIAYQYGVGKISYYARNAETDANGFDENIQVGGYNNEAPIDDRGPELSLYLNNLHFISGGITDPKPTLIAVMSDSSGINTVGNGIGHDITAVLDQKSTTPMILNDYYVSDLNTFKSGIITYPLSAMEDGPHTLTMKAWDVYNNSSEVTIDFIVISSAEFAFQHLINYPNPMRDQTTFCWETNQVNQTLEIEIRIFTLMGDLVKTIGRTIGSQGYRNVSIQWDGTQDNGRKISSGTYVYQVQVKIPDGTVKQQASKLVVIR